jgi:hypothetical protein
MLMSVTYVKPVSTVGGGGHHGVVVGLLLVYVILVLPLLLLSSVSDVFDGRGTWDAGMLATLWMLLGLPQ